MAFQVDETQLLPQETVRGSVKLSVGTRHAWYGSIDQKARCFEDKDPLVKEINGTTNVNDGVTNCNDGATKVNDGATMVNYGAIKGHDHIAKVSDDDSTKLNDGPTKVGDGATKGNGATKMTTNHISLPFQILVVLMCMVSFVLSMGFCFSLSVVYAQIVREFDDDRSVVALIQGIFETLIFISGFLWSYPVTRLGYGYCMMIGGFIGSTAIIASSFARNVPTLIILISCIAGSSFGILFLGPFIVARRVSTKYRTAIIGFVQIGNSVGMFAMPAIMEALMEEYNWNGALFVAGALCLNAIPVGIVIRIFEKFANRIPTESDTFTNKQTAERGYYKFHLFKRLVFWLLMINAFILAFTQIEIRFLVDISILKGFDRNTGSFFLTMVGVSNAVSSLLGSMSKVICKLRSSCHMSYWILISAVSHLLVMLLDTYSGLLMASVLHGLSIGSIFAHLGPALYELHGEEDYASSFAFWNVVRGAGSILGSLLGGVIFDNTGSYNLLIEIAVGMSVIYSVIFFGIYMHEKPRIKHPYVKL